MAKCKMRTEKGIRYWHPECMGGAVYGREGCTCYDQPFIDDTWIERIDQLEQRVSELEEENKIMRNSLRNAVRHNA